MCGDTVLLTICPFVARKSCGKSNKRVLELVSRAGKRGWKEKKHDNRVEGREVASGTIRE